MRRLFDIFRDYFSDFGHIPTNCHVANDFMFMFFGIHCFATKQTSSDKLINVSNLPENFQTLWNTAYSYEIYAMERRYTFGKYDLFIVPMSALDMIYRVSINGPFFARFWLQV